MAWTVDYFGNTPPDADPNAIALMAHFAPGRRASNVYVMEDGTVTTAQPPNWSPQNTDTGDHDRPYSEVWNYPGSQIGVPQYQAFSHPPNLTVRHVYWGAHVNPVYPEDEALLVAAGYGPYIECVGQPISPFFFTGFPDPQLHPDPLLFPHGTVSHPTGQTWAQDHNQWANETEMWAGA